MSKADEVKSSVFSLFQQTPQKTKSRPKAS